MYIPAVCSMYIRSELPIIAIELHGLGLLGSRMGGSATSVMVSCAFRASFFVASPSRSASTGRVIWDIL